MGRTLRSVALLALLGTAACVSDRYVGSIGRDGAYSNRGYGLVVRLKDGGLDQRWKVVDPTQLDTYPEAMRPSLTNEPIDLDGDGRVELTESAQRTVPTLRLWSRTATGAELSLDVRIVGKASPEPSLEALLVAELKRLVPTASVAVEAIEARTLPPGYQARTAEVGAVRVGLVDQPGFVGEEGLTRRQVVRVLLRAHPLTAALRADFEQLMQAVLLSRRGGAETVQEKW